MDEVARAPDFTISGGEAAQASGLTLAIWSNFPKSSFSTTTSSFGEQSLASCVKPTMSA